MGLDNPLHIAAVVLILLLLFGAKRVPQMARDLGTGIREFKEGILNNSPVAAAAALDKPPVAPAAAPAQPAVEAQPVGQPAPAAAPPAQPAVEAQPVGQPVADPQST